MTSPTNSALLSRMHSATRSEHAALNRAITDRLPLCLPPNASGPYQYTAGMTVFAQIYSAMESIRDELLQEPGENGLATRDREILETLKTRHLDRRQRLESDLHNLQTSFGETAVAGLQMLQTQARHIHQNVSATLHARPHLILAYAWPMYLALFNGGRWIAGQLLAAGPEFWLADTDTTSQDYLSFWYFDDSVHDEHHGDSVKIGFKQKLNAVSELLTPAEEDEVIAEVKTVFGICAQMVALLDQQSLELAREEQVTSPKPPLIVGGIGWSAPMGHMRTMWQSLRATVGPSAPTAGLRKDFEQHS